MVQIEIEKVLSDWHRERPDVDVSCKPIVYGISTLERALRKQSSNVLRKYNLGFGEYSILAMLRREGKPYAMQPRSLSEKLDLTSGAVSQTLNKLETAGFITRENGARDRRQVMVYLTAEGIEIVDKAFEDVTGESHMTLSKLDDTEKQDLLRILSKIAQSL